MNGQQGFDPFSQQAQFTQQATGIGSQYVQQGSLGTVQPAFGQPAQADNPFAGVTLGGQAPTFPLGTHIVEVCPGTEKDSETGRKFVKAKGNGLLLLLFVKVVESDNPAAVGSVYGVKFWCTSQYPDGDKKLWDYLATALVCLFGMAPNDPKAQKFAVELGKYIKTEFWAQGTLNGHSLLGKRAKVTVRDGGKRDPKVYWDKAA